jgi:hypothetical protein
MSVLKFQICWCTQPVGFKRLILHISPVESRPLMSHSFWFHLINPADEKHNLGSTYLPFGTTIVEFISVLSFISFLFFVNKDLSCYIKLNADTKLMEDSETAVKLQINFVMSIGVSASKNARFHQLGI